MDDELKKVSLIILGIITLLALVGLVLLFSEATQTGQAVKTVTYTKEPTTTTKSSTTPTQKETTTKTNSLPEPKSTTLTTRTSPLEKKAPSPFTPPVSSAPQPAPGDQDSDVEAAPCTTCAKQYEYKVASVVCGLRNNFMQKDVAIEANCGRIRGFRNEEHFDEGDSIYVGTLLASVRCVSGSIISFGAECPQESIMTELRPSAYTYVDSIRYWDELPAVGEVRATCEHVPDDYPLDENPSMRLIVTCMRERTS